MQSKRMSVVEVCTTTLVSGGSAALANYLVLPLIWDLHPTGKGSFEMAVFFAALGVATKYPIRRMFNKGASICDQLRRLSHLATKHPASPASSPPEGAQVELQLAAKPKTDVEFARVLVNKDGATLSVCVNGRNYQWPISQKRVLSLLASAAEAVGEMRD